MAERPRTYCLVSGVWVLQALGKTMGACDGFPASGTGLALDRLRLATRWQIFASARLTLSP